MEDEIRPGFHGWFAAALAFLAFRLLGDAYSAFTIGGLINWCLVITTGLVLAVPFIDGLKQNFYIIGGSIMAARGFINIGILLSVLGQNDIPFSASLIPNVLISFIIPIVVGIYFYTSKQVKLTTTNS